MLFLAACVTEPRKTGFRPPPPPAPVQLPPGPVATPAPPSATSSSWVQVQYVSLGSFRYDGQVLPLVSPDGRFIAVESGEPPTWPTRLADAAAEPPLGTRLAVYDISESARAPGVPPRPVEWSQRPPPGLLLGRAADSRGFLVESPRPDGSRWIGRMSWLGGNLEWLIQGDAVNAHAVFTVAGDLLFTRRERLGVDAALVLRHADGTEHARPPEGGSYAFPLAGTDPAAVGVLRLAPAGLFLEAIHLRAEEGHPTRLGSLSAQALLATPADLALAYQVCAPVQGPVPAPRTSESAATPAPGADDPPLVYHPALARMALLDTRIGAFAGLAPRSIAAVPWSASASAPGYLCTTPEGLIFFPRPPLPGDTAPARAPLLREVRVLAAPYIPRLTSDPARPVILFGPSRDPGLLEALALRPAPPEPATP